MTFLRGVLRVRGPTPRLGLVRMAELARWPLRWRWGKLVARSRPRLHSLPYGCLVKRAFLGILEQLAAAEQRAAAGHAAPCSAAGAERLGGRGLCLPRTVRAEVLAARRRGAVAAAPALRRGVFTCVRRDEEPRHVVVR